MVVEDQQIILAGIYRMITDELSCEVEMMLNAEEALECIATRPAPDVIITDIVMTGMDGLHFIEEARKLLPFCSFLIISGHDNFAFAQRAIQLGVKDYLLKPIQRKRLIGALNHLFAQREHWQQEQSLAYLNDLKLFQSSDGDHHVRFSQGVYGGLTAAFYCVRGARITPEQLLPGCYCMATAENVAIYLLLLPENRFNSAHAQILVMRGEEEISFGINQNGDLAKAFEQCAIADAYGSRDEPKDTTVRQLMRFVSTHSAQPMNVHIAASAVNLSANYASALFKRETGTSLSVFIRHCQLEAARRLLTTTDLRIYEIAEKLGYSDERHFSALFREAYNISPNELRHGKLKE